MITVPDKITTPANTSTRLVASPVNGRPDPSSVVDTEGAGFSEVVSVTTCPSGVVVVSVTTCSSGVVVSDTTGSSGVVVVVVGSSGVVVGSVPGEYCLVVLGVVVSDVTGS